MLGQQSSGVLEMSTSEESLNPFRRDRHCLTFLSVLRLEKIFLKQWNTVILIIAYPTPN